MHSGPAIKTQPYKLTLECSDIELKFVSRIRLGHESATEVFEALPEALYSILECVLLVALELSQLSGAFLNQLRVCVLHVLLVIELQESVLADPHPKSLQPI